MSTPGNQPDSDKSPGSPVELEPPASPLVEEGLPPGPDDYAVPSHPQHRCPHCDYILSGVPSRRCPECGTMFTLTDARRRALDLEDQPFSSYMRMKGILQYGLGASCLALSIVLWVVKWGLTSGWWFGALCQVFTSIFLMYTAHESFDTPWPKATAYAGVIGLLVVGAVYRFF